MAVINHINVPNHNDMIKLVPGLWWFYDTPIIIISNKLERRFRSISWMCVEPNFNGDIDVGFMMYELRRL